MKTILFIIAGLLIFQSSLFAQRTLYRGYIVNNKMDTIYGKGQMGKNNFYCLFQHSNMQGPVKYYPNEVACIRFESGKYFVPKKITNTYKKYRIFREDSIYTKEDDVFLEYLIDGEVDLFTCTFNGTQKFYMEKYGIPIEEIKFSEILFQDQGKTFKYMDPKFKGFLKVYMSDSPEIYKKIDGLKTISRVSLIDLTEEYHYSVCNSYDCINYTKKILGHKRKKEK